MKEGLWRMFNREDRKYKLIRSTSAIILLTYLAFLAWRMFFYAYANYHRVQNSMLEYNLIPFKTILSLLGNYNKYDFAFVCLGEHDINILKLDQFQTNYESLLRSIKTSNQNCEIVPIIESSIQIDKTYPLAITNLSNYYGLSLIDAREAFAKSNTPYKNLTSGGNLPNAQGYKLYASAMFDLIKVNVDKTKAVKAFDKAAMFTK
jgi:hypothetical protein